MLLMSLPYPGLVAKADTRSVVHDLAERGFAVSPEAAQRLATAEDPKAAVAATLEAIGGDVVTITVDDIPEDIPGSSGPANPPVSAGEWGEGEPTAESAPPETEGSHRSVVITGDVTGDSTGTGEYSDYVALFRDRLERLGTLLEGRVPRQTAAALERSSGGTEAGLIGLVNDIRSTRNGHRMVELEDETGTFPVLFLKDGEIAGDVETLLYDEVVGVTGRLSDDGGILFAEGLHSPDIPRTNAPTTADRPVQAALVSDIHVGSKEFLADAWGAFTDWLHTDEAAAIEYLVIAGDLVEGVGVYPDQDQDLEIVDVWEQYAAFAEVLDQVPDDLEVIVIPGNHDAVRLAEPQPGFPDDLLKVMNATHAHVGANPSVVHLEGVPFLLYHGASLDEVIAELPAETASYDSPERAMVQLLKKRHLAPAYGGNMRIAPEERDYLVIEETPAVFHGGHVHTVGVTDYRGVRVINSGCWQAQTAFQRRNNLDPEPGRAFIVELDTLEVTVRRFD